MTTPTTVKAEYLRATAAEKALSDRLSKLEAAATPPSPVTPPPASSGATVPFVAGDTPAHFASLVKDKTVTAITLAGTYKMPELYLDGDRGVVPLDIGPAAGQTYTFVSPGKTLEGLFFFGLNSPLIGQVTLHDGSDSGIPLAQSGIMEIRRATGLVIRNWKSSGVVRDPTYSDKAVKTWFAYISSKAGGGVHNVTIEGCSAVGTARSTSFVQLDSGEEPFSNVTLRRLSCSSMAYALYANIAGSGLVVDGLTATDTSENGTAVAFRQGSGTYRGVVVGPGGVSNTAAGMVAG